MITWVHTCGRGKAMSHVLLTPLQVCFQRHRWKAMGSTGKSMCFGVRQTWILISVLPEPKYSDISVSISVNQAAAKRIKEHTLPATVPETKQTRISCRCPCDFSYPELYYWIPFLLRGFIRKTHLLPQTIPLRLGDPLTLLTMKSRSDQR